MESEPSLSPSWSCERVSRPVVLSRGFTVWGWLLTYSHGSAPNRRRSTSQGWVLPLSAI